ncbi:Uncharacterized protein F751_4469 [Auxenochlorella protothecoides]|uniref:Nuclear pore protein n=1 Tax=Auxenochlorella protothecoides TaxID=3075 RepID=A0A087SN95_AUXPR|nr:Uncharacterized protein F751_4469 [Auxenochlorella protothecoides]KFM27199.1 Uncharacterized protein F751_4469 [Auxenochlorella protothecoides]
MTREPAWNELLLQSEQLIRQQDQGLPLRIERDIRQVEQFSQRLRAKSIRPGGSDYLQDADRLLAQEGLDPALLRRTMQSYELKPRPEDLLAPEAAHSVGHYVERVGQALTVAGLQTSLRGTSLAFDSYMDERMEARWQQEREALFEWTAPYSLPALPLVGPGARGSAAERTPLGSVASGGAARLRGRAAQYAEVARRLNRARAAGEEFPLAAELGAACQAEPGGTERRTSMARVWKVLGSLLPAAQGVPVTAPSRRADALVQAARRCLEEEFEAHMQLTIRNHRSKAALGASPSKLALINAYLRVSLGSREQLDFDEPGGMDTTWHRIYTALRAGLTAEAQQARARHRGRRCWRVVNPDSRVAATSRTLAGSRSTASAFPAALKEWVEGGRRPLTGATGSSITSEAERLLRDRGLRARGGSSFGHRLACYALLSGHAPAADVLGQISPPVLPTIEDFLWLRLGLVVVGGSSQSLGSGSQQGEVYGLRDLQQYLQQYPSSHYSHAGREPLQYVLVLVLTQQWTEAAAYLAQDPAARDLRVDAVYFCVALTQVGLLRDGAEDATLAEGAVLAGRLVHRYAREFLPVDAELALEHYMLAADAMGGSLEVRGRLLRELLVESRAFGLLLGSGGGGTGTGALAAFFPDAAARGAAEEAVELYMFCGRFAAALDADFRHLSLLAAGLE